MKNNRLTKVQRQVRSQRKTNTNAELFTNKIKNALRLAPKKKLMDKLIEEAEQEIASEKSSINPILFKDRTIGTSTMHLAETQHLLEKLNTYGTNEMKEIGDDNEAAQNAS